MLVQMVAYFYIYSVIGWSLEVTYSALFRGMFLDPGTLIGPWCPIYGLGMVGIIKYLRPHWKHLLWLFFGGVLIASLLELGTGIILERLFHLQWWDYTDQPFNLGAYICLPFSMAWGVGAVFMVKMVHPSVNRLVENMSHAVSYSIVGVLSLLLLMDIVLSIEMVLKL